MSSPINVGVIGCGYWGPNLVRNLIETPGASVRMVADLDSRKLQAVQQRYPTVKTTQVFMELVNDPDIHAVAIVHVAETNTYVQELIIAGATLAQPAHRSLRGGNWQSRCNLSDR